MLNLVSIFWKTMPKNHRHALLSYFNGIDQYPINKFLSNDLDLPVDFLKYKCIFIHIPKCAGTSIKNTLFTNKCHGHMPLHFYEKAHPAFYREAFKFSFVRNPISRAYSAYHYVRFGNNKRNAKFKDLISQYSDFDSFVKDWLSAENARKIHFFNPQFEYLTNSLGKLSVDFIGKQESIEIDFLNIQKRLGILTNLKHDNPSYGDKELIFKKQTIDILYEIYQKDFELFDYKIS
jgi:hypothetical protein